jgi:hypothetical protein
MFRSAAAILWILTFACGDGGSTEIETCSSRQALVGGTPAPQPRWNAAAALALQREGQSPQVYCSAALVGRTLAVTAKHCTTRTNGEPLLGLQPIVLLVGDRTDDPEDAANVIEFVPAAPHVGGVSGLGSDVALVRLDRPVGVVPFPVAEEPALPAPGRRLTVLGYGKTDRCDRELRLEGRRRLGRQVVLSLAGNVYDSMYGSFEGYMRNNAHLPDEELRRRYGRGQLLTGHELLAAPPPGGAAACHGDSGGPVLLERGEEAAELLGVMSWTWSPQGRCDRGLVVAALGREIRSVIAAVRRHEDREPPAIPDP